MLSSIVEKKGEFEVKYTFANMASSSLGSWLSSHCLKDKVYPQSRVRSIYLETINADFYSEKVNGNFLKTKFRVRWYENRDNKEQPESSDTPFFLEKKIKVGPKRLKSRWVVQARKDRVDRAPLSSTFHHQWQGLFAEKTAEMMPDLQPLIQISYIRRRFLDPFSGARLSLDYDIVVEKTHLSLLPPPTTLFLPTAVFEVKSVSGTAPQLLQLVPENLMRKASFSKYQACISHLLSHY